MPRPSSSTEMANQRLPSRMQLRGRNARCGRSRPTASSALRSKLTNTCTSRSALPATASASPTWLMNSTPAAFSSIATRLQASSSSGRRATVSNSALRTRAKSTRPSLIFCRRRVTRNMRPKRSWACGSRTVSISFSIEPCRTASGVFISCATLVLSRPRLASRSCASTWPRRRQVRLHGAATRLWSGFASA